MFNETEFMTARQKERAYTKFVNVIEKRNINLIDKNLYNHLHLHCGFVAHYNIHGFKEEYESPADFKRFVEHFLTYPWIVGCGDRSYDDINSEMIDVAKKHYDQICFELDNYNKSQEIRQLNQLAKKYGYTIEEHVPLQFETNGQGSLVI